MFAGKVQGLPAIVLPLSKFTRTVRFRFSLRTEFETYVEPLPDRNEELDMHVDVKL